MEFTIGHQNLLLFEHYLAVLSAADAETRRSGTAAPPAPLRRGIELQDVWFRYGDDQPWVLVVFRRSTLPADGPFESDGTDVRGDPGGRQWMVKRLAAGPGDPMPVDCRDAAGHDRVPAGTLVVLGGNPHASMDSRFFGPVPADRLLGVVLRPMSDTAARP